MISPPLGFLAGVFHFRYDARMRTLRSPVVFFFLALALIACGTSQREKTLRASFVTVNAARDGFVKWEAQAQARIASEATTFDAGRVALEKYRADRTKVLEGFELAYRAISAALLLEDDRSLQSAIAAGRVVVEVVGHLIE